MQNGIPSGFRVTFPQNIYRFSFGSQNQDGFALSDDNFFRTELIFSIIFYGLNFIAIKMQIMIDGITFCRVADHSYGIFFSIFRVFIKLIQALPVRDFALSILLKNIFMYSYFIRKIDFINPFSSLS